MRYQLIGLCTAILGAALTLAPIGAPADTCRIADAKSLLAQADSERTNARDADALRDYLAAFNANLSCSGSASALIAVQAVMGQLETDHTNDSATLRDARFSLAREALSLLRDEHLSGPDRVLLGNLIRQFNLLSNLPRAAGPTPLPEIAGEATGPADWEEGVLVKDVDSGRLEIIQRHNGDRWLLEAQTFCLWCFMHEGEKVLINFGYVVTKIMPISGDQQAASFWTKSAISP